MNPQPDSPKPIPHPVDPVASTPAPDALRRQQLLAQECAKRGVRFLPSQVMRSIYEREGLL